MVRNSHKEATIFLRKSSLLYVLFTFLFPALISSLQLPLPEKSKEQ